MNITVNGKEHNVGILPSATYELVTGWAGFSPDRVLSVTYSTRRSGDEQRQGSLRRGRVVALEDRMSFCVADTGSA